MIRPIVYYMDEGNDSLFPPRRYGPMLTVVQVWFPEEDEEINEEVVERHAFTEFVNFGVGMVYLN